MRKVITTLVLMLVAYSPINAQEYSEVDDSTYMSSYHMEELFIKTQKRDKDYKEMPLSLSPISYKAMENSGVEGIRDISALVPNLFITNYGTKLSSSAYIRGVGNRISSPSVGLYVDGMPYYEKSSFDFDFNGIEFIEVLRGPQGTLYGRNSLGGVINVYTKSPLTYQGTDIELEAGGYGVRSISGSHYDKIGDKFGYGVSLDYSHQNGYFDNLYTGDEADGADQGSARLRLGYQISDSLTIEAIGSVDIVDQLGYPYAILDLESGEVADVNYNSPSKYLRTLATAGLSLNYKHRKFELSSQTSYLYVDDYQGVDQDFSADDLYYAIQRSKQNVISQEVNISGRTSNRYRWLVGAFGFYQKQDNNVNIEYRQMDMVTDKNYGMPTYGAALYHQSTFDDLLTDGLSLTLGLRYDYENASQDYYYDLTMSGNMSRVEEFTNDLSFKQFLPKFALQYSCGDANIYATISKGYKAGGFNTSFSDEEEASYSPEYTWNYEIGYKQSLLNGKISSELALFYIDWRDQQVYQTISTGTGSMLRNAGHSTSKGVEASLYFNPIHLLNIGLNYGYTYAKFDDYQKSDEVSYSGNYIPFVPKNTLGINADYSIYRGREKFINNILFGASYMGQGSIYWDDANAIKEDYYGILNARVEFSTKLFSLELWGRNLTNQKYYAFEFSSLGNEYVQQGLPLNAGVTIKINL